MIGTSEKRRLTFEQAARWFLWLRDHKADPAKVEVFQRWCNNSGQNRRAYEKVEHLWQACNGVDPLDLPWPTELELAQDEYDGSYSLPLPAQGGGAGVLSGNNFVLDRKSKAKSRFLVSWRAAAAVCLTAVLLAFTAPKLMEWAGRPTPYYSTDVAQQRVETLSDGSVITLGGATRLSVQYSRDLRRVVLEQGEAYFEVAKDSTRPFVVRVADSEVRAVGTAFNIVRRDDAATVSVIEGVVDVTQSGTVPAQPAAAQGGQTQSQTAASNRQERLTRGQELTFSRDGDTWKTKQHGNLDRATGWRDGRLAYIDERLDRVLQDINRYSPQKIVIGDWELGDLRYTGTVFSKDVTSWLQGLEQAFALRVLTVDDRTVLVKNTTSKKS